MAHKKKIGSGEMMEDNDAKPVELAFDYISAETEPQANQQHPSKNEPLAIKKEPK